MSKTASKISLSNAAESKEKPDLAKKETALPQEEDIDALANDEDLSVYEDDDGFDSAEESSTEPEKQKISGYKMIKQIEDSRHHNSSMITSKINEKALQVESSFQVS